MKITKISVYGDRKKQNWLKKNGIKIEEVREWNGYGMQIVNRTAEIDTNTKRRMTRELNAKMKKEKPKKDPQEAWCARLVKLTDISLEEAEKIAQEKLDYQEELIDKIWNGDYQTDGAVNRAIKRANQLRRQNPLRRIQNEEHAQFIIAASRRHNDSNYEDKLEEAKEMVSWGMLDREEVRDYARQNMQFYK